MLCPKCGTQNPSTGRFCQQCGTPLSQVPSPPPPPPPGITRLCPKCGTENPTTGRFCQKCGTPLTRVPAPPAPTQQMNGPKPASQAKKWVPVIIVFIVGAIFFFIFQSVHPFGLNSNSGTSNQAIVYSNQGINLLNEAKYDEAIANFNKAIEIDDKYANAYSGRGLGYYRMGQYDLAMADYNKAIELDPNDATAWHNKGVALEKLGRNEEAQVCYKMESQIDAINAAGGTQDNNTA